jgi:two-component system sensor histidine kinase and response regulator WspE
MVRVTAENLNRLMDLAGESLVESRWLEPFANALRQLKHSQLELADVVERLREALARLGVPERVVEDATAVRRKVDECRHMLSDRLIELELFARRSENLSDRLYREAIASRMRPFDDGVQGFPRMVRDIARRLGKKVTLEISGRATKVDRDILERLEAPLSHLLRNAIDHGIEPPEERLAIGKPAEGTIRLEAAHRGGPVVHHRLRRWPRRRIRALAPEDPQQTTDHSRDGRVLDGGGAAGVFVSPGVFHQRGGDGDFGTWRRPRCRA